MWTGPIGEIGTYDHGMTLLFYSFSSIQLTPIFLFLFCLLAA